MPRTAKYHNSEFCERFAQIVEATGSEETAIRRSGIGRETYYGWKRAWKKATQKSRDADRNFFFERIEDAISNRKAKVEQDFIDGFKGGSPTDTILRPHPTAVVPWRETNS